MVIASIFGTIEEVVEVLLHIPEYVLFAGETLINVLIAAAEVLLEEALSPLPDLPTLTAPAFVHEINWFFPIGAVFGLLLGGVSVIVAYRTWLAVRWVFRKIGQL